MKVIHFCLVFSDYNPKQKFWDVIDMNFIIINSNNNYRPLQQGQGWNQQSRPAYQGNYQSNYQCDAYNNS